MQRFQKIFLTLIQTKVFGSALRRTHLIRYAAKDAGPPKPREDALRADENFTRLACSEGYRLQQQCRIARI